MPVYQVSYQHGRPLTEDMKAKMAAAITDAHVELTGAPRIFVHTFFNELPPGVSYSSEGPDHNITGITGSIRAGRPLDEKQALIKRIVASWTEITGQSPKQVLAGLTEIVSEMQMEYGLILPRPGDEPQWFADNADALDGISGTGL
jgi:phenylpyruvate tautomerase PptA (4-oxalocrotonate tautomerase family)